MSKPPPKSAVPPGGPPEPPRVIKFSAIKPPRKQRGGSDAKTPREDPREAVQRELDATQLDRRSILRLGVQMTTGKARKHLRDEYIESLKPVQRIGKLKQKMPPRQAQATLRNKRKAIRKRETQEVGVVSRRERLQAKAVMSTVAKLTKNKRLRGLQEHDGEFRFVNGTLLVKNR